MQEGKFIDRLSIIIALVTLIISFIIFFRNTSEFGGSLAAAIITAGLIWATYIILRWLLLANRS